MSRIEAAFQSELNHGRRALVPYLTAGFPDLNATDELLDALVAGGADVIELGVPFSDPIADGPTIQRACTAALAAGCTTQFCLQAVERFRKRGHNTPIVLFGAYNPFFHYGIDAFCRDAKAAGVDGLLIPDLPSEESDEILPTVKAHGLDLVLLVAPTTPPARKAEIAAKSAGFVYYISLKGVTGARTSIELDLETPVRELKAGTKLPVAVGFGISTPTHARAVARVADGVIVGSALIDVIAQANPAERAYAVKTFLGPIKAALGELTKA